MDAIFKKQQDISLGVFIDVKKAFDTVDHKILLRKLEFYGFGGVELKLIANYLSQRYQFTDINGMVSELVEILAGVPQGSILGPLLFLIYVNDFPFSTSFNSFLFADDTSLLLSDKSLNSLQIKAQEELHNVEDWFNANKMQLNSKKTRYIIFNLPRTRRDDPFELKLGGEKLCRVSADSKETSVCLVGVELDEDFSFKHHVTKVKAKLSSINFVLARSKNILPTNIKILIYNTLARSVLDFASVLYGAARKGTIGMLEKIQKKIVRNIKGALSRAHTNELYLELGILKLHDQIELNQAIFGHGVWYRTLPTNILSDFEPLSAVGSQTRAVCNKTLKVPFCKKRFLESAPCFAISSVWNNLDIDLKSNAKRNSFKNNLHSAFFDHYRNEPRCSLVKCFSCARNSGGL